MPGMFKNMPQAKNISGLAASVSNLVSLGFLLSFHFLTGVSCQNWTSLALHKAIYSCSNNTCNKYKKGAAAYQLGNTSSRTITEVKQRWARLVLGWETVQVLPELSVAANP